MKTGPLDLKNLLEEFNNIQENPIHENNSDSKLKNPTSLNSRKPSKEFRPLIEGFDVSKHLGSGIYQMRHPDNEDDVIDNKKNINSQNKPIESPTTQKEDTLHQPIPKREEVPTDASNPIETKTNPIPEEINSDGNIIFDGNFSSAEKKAISSEINNMKWQPMFQRELLVSKEDLLNGFNDNPDLLVRTIDENKNVSKIPYKLFDKLFNRSSEVTLNINNNAIKTIVMIPKNYEQQIEATGYGDTHALIKINDGEKINITEMDEDLTNVIYTQNKKQSVRNVEKELSKPINKPKSVPKPNLQMVDEDSIDSTEPVKPEVKKEPEISKSEDKLKDKSKPITKPKLRMVEELPEPQDIVGKNIIVNSEDTGKKDVKVRINSYDPKTNTFSVNWKNGNWRGIPHDFLKKSFIRLAAT